QGFDFEQGPMVRHQLFRLADDGHLLLWSTHYMVFDPESAELVLDELGAAYVARRAGDQPAPLPPPQPYADYARAQREWAEGDEARLLLDEWRDALAGWQATELPLDHRRPGQLDLASAIVTRPLPAGAAAAARDLAHRLGATRDAVGLAAYAALVHRYTRQTDLLLGVPGRATVAGGEPAPVGSYGT